MKLAVFAAFYFPTVLATATLAEFATATEV
jgi:hypothetical protein